MGLSAAGSLSYHCSGSSPLESEGLSLSLITLELRVSMTQAGWLLDMHASQQRWAPLRCVCPCGLAGREDSAPCSPPGLGLCLMPYFSEVSEKGQSYPLPLYPYRLCCRSWVLKMATLVFIGTSFFEEMWMQEQNLKPLLFSEPVLRPRLVLFSLLGPWNLGASGIALMHGLEAPGWSL